MKDYLGETIDLTGDNYLNPVPAVYDNGIHKRNLNAITSISIHHDASVRPHDYDSVQRYRNEAATHYKDLGPGLQYHYKIDNVGQIFKIRPLDTWLYVVGSSENVSTLAICLDGCFHPPYNQTPTREQYEALGQLLVNLCEQHPEFPATYPDVRPHRDFSSTACPGDTFAPWVYDIQSKADVLNIPESAVYDWPEYQDSPPDPAIPTPTPPTVVINYRVKDASGKQIGAYTNDRNAWVKHAASSGSRIYDQAGNDVTTQLESKFASPLPELTPQEQAHDYTVEDHSLLVDIKNMLQQIWDKLRGTN